MASVQSGRLYRGRLVERIERAAEKRVVLVAAGAGYGKSIVVRQALDVLGSQAFFRVPPETKTLLGFLRGLTEALEASVPGAHLSLAIAYERAIQSASPATELARWFGEHLRDATIRVAVDDLQNAAAAGVPEFVQRSIEATPDGVRWLLAARDLTSFPVASWLAHGTCDVPIDEADLRFTRPELDALAARIAPGLTPAQVGTIAQQTGGWPAAIGLALPLGDVGIAGKAAQALSYDELAGRVIDAIDEPELTDILKSAVVTDVFGYGSLFRTYLLKRLRERGPELEQAACAAAARDFETRGDVRSALVYYQQAGMKAAMSRILASHGVALMDGGFADVVELAVAALDRAGYDGGPPVMLLKAIRDAHLVRFDSAEAWFQLAIAGSADDDDLRLRIIHRYTLDLLRRGRVDGIEVLEAAIASASDDHPLKPLLSATLATAYTLVDRLDDARVAIASAVDRLTPNLPAALRTRAYHQAAYVALRCGDIPEARRNAERVLEVAIPHGFYDLAARAHSILYEIAHAWDAHPRRALAHVESVAAFGLKSGDAHIRQWALLAAYYIEAERGNAAMMSQIERALNAPEVLQTTEESTAALLPGQALRATWSGDFEHAFRLLATTAGDQVSPDRRAFRWAEIAVFAAAAGRVEEAREAAGAAQRELSTVQTGKHGVQARAYLLIALSLLSEAATWSELRDAVGDDERARPGSDFIRAAESLHGHWHGERDHNSVLASLETLRDADFCGIAAMFEALPAIPAYIVKTA